MKILAVEGEVVACGRKDRQTEMTKLIFTFRTLSAHTVFVSYDYYKIISTNSVNVLVCIRRTAMFSVRKDVEFKYHLRNLRTSKAVPWLRRVVAGLSPRRAGFDTRSVRARYVMDKMTLRRVHGTRWRRELLHRVPHTRTAGWYAAMTLTTSQTTRI
jgi:hypothetical protein